MSTLEQNLKKPKLLLHICCISCGAYVSQVLSEDYDLTLFFYNSNIFPESEYQKRLETVKAIAGKQSLNIIFSEYDHSRWLEKVEGLEAEPERGKRCMVCYADRIGKTAQYAAKNNFDYFTTTLTISPHKCAKSIIDFGNKFAKTFGVEFLEKDFKKKDGFKKSVELSCKLNLYRQNYCGCEFSL